MTVLLPSSLPGGVCLVEPRYEFVREDVVVELSLRQEGGSQQHQAGGQHWSALSE